jgi:hexulose-6-phosphate isomerase
MRIAVMQGRLLPPYEGHFQSFPLTRWREEFARAAAAGLDAIEWIYDSVSEFDNPLGTAEGLAEMRELGRQNEIAVVSVCADYFMEHPLARGSEAEREVRFRKLVWLLSRCEVAGVRRVVIPFVDNSKIDNETDETAAVQVLRRALGYAERSAIELHLETSLDPEGFGSLLDKLPHPLLKANYDSGNSSSLGYDPVEEIAAYGERIGSVHIKDRIRGGGTVPLGTGDAKIPLLLSELRRIGYGGDFVMQIARGVAGEEVAWIRQNREMVVGLLDAAGFVCEAKR